MNKSALILYGFICLIVGVVGATPLLSFLIGFIPSNISLVTLNPFDGINTIITLIVVSSFVLFNLGLLSYFLVWVQDALTEKEKRIVNSLFPKAIILFVVGLCFGFFSTTLFIFPAMVKINSALGLVQIWGYGDTLVSLMILVLVCGLCFELPLVIRGLVGIGFVDVKVFKDKRLFILLGIFIIVNLITPTGDILTSLLFGIPLYVLFELSLVGL